MESKSGLQVFNAPVANISVDRNYIQRARAALKSVGFVILRGVVSDASVVIHSKSLVSDFKIHAGSKLPRAINVGSKDLSANNIDHALSVIEKHVSAAFERAQLNLRGNLIDGLLHIDGLPLTINAQLRRLHPGVRNVFARIYGVQQDDLLMYPEPARAVVSLPATHILDEPTPADILQKQRPGPVSAMREKLAGAQQMPYRMTSRTGIVEEMKRRLTRGVLSFDIMGAVCYTASRAHALDGEISPTGKQAAALDAGFVFSPGKQNIPVANTNIGPNPSTRKFRKMSTCSYQRVTDNELETLRYFFVPTEPGDVILWRRDVPFAWKNFDKECTLREEQNSSLLYGAQHIGWLPREGRLESESLALQLLYNNHRAGYNKIYNVRTPELPRSRKRKKKQTTQICLNSCTILSQHYITL